MNSDQKAAFTRVLIDLIKADKVIDSREIDNYRSVKKRFNIKKVHEQDAYLMTLGDSLDILKTLDPEEKEEIIKVFEEMTLTDGNAPREEALLMLMIHYSLVSKDLRCDVISKHIEEAWFDERQVLFVESSHDKDINFAISNSYRDIENQLRLCGFEFVYLPQIISHYISTPRSLFEEVVSILSPSLSEEAVMSLLTKIRLFKSDSFCKEQLANKLDFFELRQTFPAILLRLSQSRIGREIVTNFLRIEVTPDIVNEIRDFCDRFLSYMSNESDTISYMREEKGRFLYKGFYRQLFEILLLQKSVVSNLLIDFTQGRSGSFSFDGINQILRGLHRRDKALYLMFLFIRARDLEKNLSEEYAGWVDFSFSNSPEALKRINYLRELYGHIYYRFNGDTETAPDITDPTIRRPIISNINKTISQHQDKIYQADTFKIVRNQKNGTYSLPSDPHHFHVKGWDNEIQTPFMESSIFKSLKEFSEKI